MLSYILNLEIRLNYQDPEFFFIGHSKYGMYCWTKIVLFAHSKNNTERIYSTPKNVLGEITGLCGPLLDIESALIMIYYVHFTQKGAISQMSDHALCLSRSPHEKIL
jgi:hypothetical protein